MNTVLKRKDLILPELSYTIIGCAFDVDNELGQGNPEKYYQGALAHAFARKGLKFQEQVYCKVIYAQKVIGKRFLDFLIEDKIIIEIKKDNRYAKTHIDQVLDYLKLNQLKLALLINFGNAGVQFKRVVNFS